jgi:hypothetical protein
VRRRPLVRGRRLPRGSQVAWGARVVGWAEGRKRRQIHVRPEKVGTSFCLHFVLFLKYKVEISLHDESLRSPRPRHRGEGEKAGNQDRLGKATAAGRRRAQAGTGRAGRGYSFRHTYSSEPKQQLTPHRLQGTASRRRVSLPPPALR